jgi:hypothetical protein
MVRPGGKEVERDLTLAFVAIKQPSNALAGALTNSVWQRRPARMATEANGFPQPINEFATGWTGRAMLLDVLAGRRIEIAIKIRRNIAEDRPARCVRSTGHFASNF